MYNVSVGPRDLSVGSRLTSQPFHNQTIPGDFILAAKWIIRAAERIATSFVLAPCYDSTAPRLWFWGNSTSIVPRRPRDDTTKEDTIVASGEAEAEADQSLRDEFLEILVIQRTPKERQSSKLPNILF